MTEEYSTYQKFTDILIAEEIAEELKANGIEYSLVNNLHSYVNVFGFNPIDFPIALNLKSGDFRKADIILDKFYKKEIENVNKDYYLFEFSDQELHEIILNPYDWGHFDYQLAKHLLQKKGEEISDSVIQKLKDDRVSELSIHEKVSIAKLVFGYIFSILMPIAAIIIGITIVYNRKLLPNGEFFYIHSKAERNQGTYILVVSIAWSLIVVFAMSYQRN